MHFHVLTLFPEMIEQGMNTSIMGRAIERGYISLKATDIRDYALRISIIRWMIHRTEAEPAWSCRQSTGLWSL